MALSGPFQLTNRPQKTISKVVLLICLFKKGIKYSFSKKIKNNVKKAVKYIGDFELTASELAIENHFDYVITFQVIEHIEPDSFFLAEAARVLKPGGKLYLTTVNRKFSLTRNPWHVREYLAPELRDLMKKHFSEVITEGVHGNQKVMDYYEENKVAVKKITRFDIFNLQYKLPRTWLQVPYDIANRMSRLSMSKSNNSLVSSIQVDDYFLSQDPDHSLDFFYTGIK